MSAEYAEFNMTLIVETLFELVKTHMRWDTATTEKWFNTPNKDMGNMTPFYMIAIGQGDLVRKWLDYKVGANDGGH